MHVFLVLVPVIVRVSGRRRGDHSPGRNRPPPTAKGGSPKGLEYFLTATYWLNRKSPFGVVAAELDTSVSSGDPPQSTKNFRIVKSGEGAASRLPDAK
ncbi:MAG: hypothetical protein ACYTG0_27705 [Planctomycetota bacterium]|jgi:hypothetical protein